MWKYDRSDEKWKGPPQILAKALRSASWEGTALSVAVGMGDGRAERVPLTASRSPLRGRLARSDSKERKAQPYGRKRYPSHARIDRQTRMFTVQGTEKAGD